MKKFKKLFVLILFAVMIAGSLAANDLPESNERVIAMCRPLVSQIRNIEELYEKDIITRDRVKLVCVFHEKELTDYQPSFEYVEKNKLSWVEFFKIRGEVGINDLFKENTWTAQFKRIFDESHGIIFTGGMDIPPAVYGEENRLLTEATTPVRSLYEISFLFHLVGGSKNPGFSPFLESRRAYPVLAICLGAQSLNVAAGGTMIQDIPSEVYRLDTLEQVLELDKERVHSGRYQKALYPRAENLAPAFHRIRLKKGSLFLEKMEMKRKSAPFVLTSHHQAVEKLGKDLVVTAVSMDGKIVEALEHKKFENVLGVQFHPEVRALFSKSKYFRENPGAALDFNLRRFLLDNPPAMKFHLNLWKWFSEAL